MKQPSDSWAPPAQQEIPSTTSQHHQGVPANETHNRQRVYLWVAAGFAWVVWALAVTAAAHDKWMRAATGDYNLGIGAGNELLLDLCDDDRDDTFDSFCMIYRVFTATQFAATVMCSIAVALLALAAFRPAVGCASAKSLAGAGGLLLISYAVLQLVAAVLVGHFAVQEVEDIGAIVKVGLTLWVGVAGLVLALFTSVCILVKAKHAGQGPFYGVGRLWIASGLAWVVWALAVTAAAHDEWLLLYIGDAPVHSIFDGGVGPADVDALGSCKIFDVGVDYDDNEQFKSLCDFYHGFTATQFAATVVCSIAVALLAVAAFRPAAAGCSSVKTLANAGGVVLIVYAVVQLGAAVLAHLVAKEWEHVYNNVLLQDDGITSYYELEFGPTFWIGLVGLVLALIASSSLFVSAKHAGNGPFYGGGVKCGGVEDGEKSAQHGAV